MSRPVMPRVVEDTTGAALIEFALTLPILLLIIVGILDFGLMFQKYQVVTNAAREGARMAILPYYLDADVIAQVARYVHDGGVTETPDTAVTSDTVTPANGPAFIVSKVTVTVTHPFAFVGPIMGLFGGATGGVPLTAVSVMRKEIVALARGGP